MAVVISGLSGCGTVQEHRIRQFATIYASYDTATQEKVRMGVVEPGFTERMVYIALGTPRQKMEISPGHTAWLYLGYPVTVTLVDGSCATAYRTNADLVFGGLDPLKPIRAVFIDGKLVELR